MAPNVTTWKWVKLIDHDTESYQKNALKVDTAKSSRLPCRRLFFFEEFYFFLWFDYKFDENEMAIVQTRMGGDLKNNKSVDQELHNFSIHTKNLNSGNVRSFDTKNIDVAWSELS